jgi:succinyl-CoA synthetase beta subunit
MVNGAGLAMATMDIIKLYGGGTRKLPRRRRRRHDRPRHQRPSRSSCAIPTSKGILVNIFGGIMRCDVIAEGVVAAAREVSLNVPLVVRLAGTNVDLGKKILAESGLPIVSADDLGDAASKIVKEVKEAAG